MDRQQIRRRLEEMLRPQRLLCSALALGVVFYAIVALALVGTGVLGPVLELATEIQALAAGVGIVVALVATPVARSFRARAEAARPRSPERLIEALRRSILAGFVMRETGAVLGFLVTLLPGNVLWVLLTSGVALVTMALAWPRRDAVEDWVVRHGLAG